MNYISGVLSFLLTGLGQLRNGNFKKGLLFMFGPVVLLVIISQLGLLDEFYGMIITLCIFLAWKIWCIVDAVNAPKAENGILANPLVLGIVLCIWLFLPRAVFEKQIRKHLAYVSFSVPTTSMKSTLLLGDVFLSKRISPNDVERGEVSVFIYPNCFWEVHYNKRCVGLPGDEIEIKEGQVFANGVLENESPNYQNEYTVTCSERLSPTSFKKKWK